MTDKEAIKLALDALKEAQTNNDGMEKWDRNKKAIIALEEALAQPEQEPAAWMDEYGDVLSASIVNGKGLRNIPLYAHPPQRTEPAQQKKVWTFWDLSGGDITDAIKAKLKEKNT
jgi:hypothetical protein